VLIAEDPTVIVKCRTAIKVLFFCFNLCQSVKFDVFTVINIHIISSSTLGTGICSQANLIIFICSANVFPEPIGPRIICTGVSKAFKKLKSTVYKLDRDNVGQYLIFDNIEPNKTINLDEFL
jgi:hypothetical protein